MSYGVWDCQIWMCQFQQSYLEKKSNKNIHLVVTVENSSFFFFLIAQLLFKITELYKFYTQLEMSSKIWCQVGCVFCT